MKYIVYQTINTVNNKIYIGVHETQNPEIFDGYLGCGCRVNIPSSYQNPKSPFQAALKKYGCSKFKRSTLFIFNTLQEAYDKEAEIVTYEFIRRKDTYNAQLGGFGGGHILNPINQFDLNGNYIKTWNTIKAASEFYGISHTAIMNAVKFKGSSNNYFWSHENKINIEEFSIVEKHPCYKYDGETLKFLEGYESIKEAAQVNDNLEQAIRRSIQTGYKIKGYYYSDKVFDFFEARPKLSLKKATIYVYDLDGKYITSLTGTSEITKYFNVKTCNSIIKSIKSNLPYKQFQIKLKYVESLNPVVNKRNISKKIIQFTETGNFVKEFNSITEAVKIYGTGVQKVLRGQQKHCKHFIFKFKEEVNDIV